MEGVLILIGFAAVHLLAVMSPGPSFLVVARASVAGSRSTGIWSALGMGVGSVVWALAALFGLDALFQIAPWVYTTLKFAGALFLLYLAFRLWRHADRPMATLAAAGPTDRSALAAFRLGLLTQLANPKVVVFFGSIFLAVLPAARPSWMTPALLAIVFLDEVLWYAAVALAFSVDRLRAGYLRVKRVIDRVTGGFLGLLGLRLLGSP
ncbi:MAG: LysE family transporter [Alphaproteobacteria bacterium]